MKIAASLMFIATLWAGPVLAQSASPPAPRHRIAVAEIAQALEDGYYDAARGKEIADQLRAEAEEGRYDAMIDPRDLATTLTRRLKPLDGHFNVDWRDPTGTAALERAGSLQPVPQAIGAPRRGFGFRSVDILPGNVAVIDMRSFAGFDPDNPAARRQADAALQFASGADAVIFDLRDNGGGAPAMVGYLVSAFVAPDADVYNTFRRRDGTAPERPQEGFATPRTEVPLFVVMSGRSASAAEGFAYTLQSAKRATIVGERSSGAANPGGPVPTPSGFSIFVPVGSPVNPITGRNWESTGVQPDIEVPAEDALTEAWKAALRAQQVRLSGSLGLEARWVLEALEAPPIDVDPTAYAGVYGASEIVADSDGLSYRSARRPAWRLRPLGADLFFNREEPHRRVEFSRNAAGEIDALEILDAQTGSARFIRRGE